MVDYLFGVPFYKSSVESTRYDKEKIIEDIHYNYTKDPKRNQWDGVSDLHHSYNDDENLNFRKIDYSSLIPVYQQHVQKFLDLYFDVGIKYNFYIANYTCFAKGQHMRVHNHPNSCFSGVHYLKFNSNEHEPTMYWNPADWAFYTETFFKKEMRSSHSNNSRHSWIKENFKFKVQEDDIVITPATLRHSVPVSNSDELRMVIVFHIDITE